MKDTSNYCGCCGRLIQTGHSNLWCTECLPHVGCDGPLWERTYLALTGKPCPFQVDTNL